MGGSAGPAGSVLSAAFTGGISPFVATALLTWAGSYWPIAIYLAAMALITLVSLYFLPETYRSEISEELVPTEKRL